MLKFIKTAESYWRGNGFGTAGASWSAQVDGVEVATFDGSHDLGDYADGRPRFTGSVTRWKRAISAEFGSATDLTAAQKKVLSWVAEGLISWNAHWKQYAISGRASYASPATYTVLTGKGFIRREGATVVSITEAGKAALG